MKKLFRAAVRHVAVNIAVEVVDRLANIARQKIQLLCDALASEIGAADRVAPFVSGRSTRGIRQSCR